MKNKLFVVLICVLIIIGVISCGKTNYTVTFYDFDYSIIKIENVEKGRGTIYPKSPDSKGDLYIFGAWSEDVSIIYSDLDVVALYLPIFYYSEYNDKIILDAYTNIKELESITIPDKIENKQIHAIASSFFSYDHKRNDLIKKITFEGGVEVIGAYAFSDCLNLETVEFAYNGINIIEEYAFYNDTALKEINFPESLSIIGDYSFQNCISLKNIQLPTQLQYIGESAFYQSGIEFISIPDNDFARVENGLLIVNYGTIKKILYSFSKEENIVIPDDVLSISSNVFANNPYLKSIDLNNVENLYPYAFLNSTNLETVIGEKIRNTDIGIFEGTKYSNQDNDIIILGSSLLKLNSNDVIYYVPDNIKSIGSNAFHSETLETIVLPYEFDFIGSFAFFDCKNLERIILTSYQPPIIDRSPFYRDDVDVVVPFIRLNDYLKYQNFYISKDLITTMLIDVYIKNQFGEIIETKTIKFGENINSFPALNKPNFLGYNIEGDLSYTLYNKYECIFIYLNPLILIEVYDE